jgi:hypothetical protein
MNHTHTAQLNSCAETREVALGLKVCGEGGARGIRRRYKEGPEAGDAKQTIRLMSCNLMRLTGEKKVGAEVKRAALLRDPPEDGV